MKPPFLPLQPPPPDPKLTAPTPKRRRGRPNGKVARLPKTVRDQIDGWLLDGLTYPEIIQRLGPHGQGLTPNNLCQWKKRGHQNFLVQQMFVERVRMTDETPLEVAREIHVSETNRAALHLGVIHMFNALRDLGPGSLDQKLGGDVHVFLRLISALARFSEQSHEPDPYRQVCARARAALAPLLNQQPLPNEAQLRAILFQLDNILAGCT